MSCGPCSEIAKWFATRGALSLEVVPAETHPHRDLRRITYELADGSAGSEEGVAALARALEHINLAWAMLGFLVRLPIVCPLLQLFADVSGGEERVVERGTPAVCSTPEGSARAS